MEFVELLVKSSHDLLDSIRNIDKYLFILRQIAANYDTISKRSSLILEMKKAPILLAFRMKNSGSGIGDNRGFNHFVLASAKEIFINDNTVYQQIFNPLVAPRIDYLIECLYKVCLLLLFIHIIRHILLLMFLILGFGM